MGQELEIILKTMPKTFSFQEFYQAASSRFDVSIEVTSAFLMGKCNYHGKLVWSKKSEYREPVFTGANQYKV